MTMVKCVLLALGCFSLARAVGSPEAAIKSEMSAQQDAWNAGDIPKFMTSYAADCTFVGQQVLHGKDALERRYRERYGSRAAMGTLTFSNIEVKPLDTQIAVVTGNWHLERPAGAGGAAGGIFSLVWQLREGRWRIVLDHTA